MNTVRTYVVSGRNGRIDVEAGGVAERKPLAFATAMMANG